MRHNSDAAYNQNREYIEDRLYLRLYISVCYESCSFQVKVCFVMCDNGSIKKIIKTNFSCRQILKNAYRDHEVFILITVNIFLVKWTKKKAAFFDCYSHEFVITMTVITVERQIANHM